MVRKILNSKLFLVLVLVFIFVWLFNKSNRYYYFISKKQVEYYPILSDGSGYYGYLPQWFIYKTDNFEFLDTIQKKYPHARFADNFTYDKSTKIRYNKYFIGTAILQAPVFIVTHLVATLTHQPADGYSNIYQLSVTINAFIFTFLGLFMVFKTLGFFQLSRFTKLLTILVLITGTNLSYFTVFNPAFSHVYSFAIISMFVYFLFKWRSKDNSIRYLPIFAVLLGLIFLIRPTDILIGLLLPFFFVSIEQFRSFIKSVLSRKGLAFLSISVVLFLFLIGLQVLSTYQQRGIFALNNYTGESFDNWLKPEIINVLFSVRKGLFVYAPILLIAVIGFIPLWKKERFLSIGILLFLIVFTYITASWWCWWYGGGLGMRPYINILILFALPFGILFQTVQKYIKLLLLFISLACIFLYQTFQTQMIQNILHYDDMNSTQFKKVFLQTGHRFDWSLHREFDSLPTQKADFIKTESIENKSLKIYHDYQLDKCIKIVVDVDTNYKQWAGTITGYVKITNEDQNPNFDVKYFKDDQLIKQEGFFFGGELPSVNKFHPLTMNFNPKDIEPSSYNKVEIVLYPGAEILYFNHAEFQSFYYK